MGQTYPSNRQSTFRMPVAGIYTLRAPESFSQTSWGANNNGDLVVALDPQIVGPTNEGFTVRRTKVSGKVFQRKGENVSFLGDYLLATGYNGGLPGDPHEQAAIVEQTVGKTFQAELDWRSENFRTGFKLEGMRKFPKNADGSYQSWVEDPTEKNEDGSPKRLLANLYIRNYIPATA